MSTKNGYIRPITLVEGQSYLCRQRLNGSQEFTFTPVIFQSYTSCPAFSIVINGAGGLSRCPRDELFTPSNQWDANGVQDNVVPPAGGVP